MQIGISYNASIGVLPAMHSHRLGLPLFGVIKQLWVSYYSTGNDRASSCRSVPSASELLYIHEVFGHLHSSPDRPRYAVAWRVSICGVPYIGTGIFVKA